jgi:hypothetical protein
MSALPTQRILLVATLCLWAAGCKETTDLDQRCRLMQPDPSDNTKLVILKDGDPSINPAFDFISSGDSDCDDLVCIRLHNGNSTTYPPDESGNATGKCSRPCIEKGDCGEPEKGLVCNQLGLDPDFINGLPPDIRQKYLGETGSLFCVNPNDESVTQ